MKYNPRIVTAYLAEFGIPEPVYEHRFHPTRQWRFDLAWPDNMLALEVQGGLFLRGRHTNGAALRKEYEKLTAAAVLGWRVMFVEPKDLCMNDTAMKIQAALNCVIHGKGKK